MSGAQKPHATGPGYLSVEFVGCCLWFISDLWDGAPKALHRGHSLFKGVFPIPQRKPSKEGLTVSKQTSSIQFNN